MQKLIAAINQLGYNVQIYQYGTWLNSQVGRWEATATTPDGKMMSFFAFDQTPLAALAKLKAKIADSKENDQRLLQDRAHAEQAAAHRGSAPPAPKAKDPFDWEADEEDALS